MRWLTHLNLGATLGLLAWLASRVLQGGRLRCLAM